MWGIRTEQFRFMNVKDWCLKLLTGRLVPNHDPSIDEIMLFASLYVEAALSTDQASDQSFPMHVIWVPPPPRWIKIKVDTVVRDEKAIGAVVAWHTQCRTLAARIVKCQCLDPLVAEIATLLLGV
ncbi:hypothetical protein PanWU01x14_013040 [Parasponia andersonii]|uniref:Uncharacterized protein n=1 Tax=Parasponia andersonii TaxID=3476 RepID=A0A2P5E0Y8_PARAD|nr:hypothetical protein PanWU01x14_013040 [Parasponia andersonii]